MWMDQWCCVGYLEERQVVLEELGHVGVTHGTDEQQVLIRLRLLTLQLPRRHEHRLDGAHAEVVVVLLRQLQV